MSLQSDFYQLGGKGRRESGRANVIVSLLRGSRRVDPLLLLFQEPRLKLFVLDGAVIEVLGLGGPNRVHVFEALLHRRDFVPEKGTETRIELLELGGVKRTRAVFVGFREERLEFWDEKLGNLFPKTLEHGTPGCTRLGVRCCPPLVKDVERARVCRRFDSEQSHRHRDRIVTDLHAQREEERPQLGSIDSARLVNVVETEDVICSKFHLGVVELVREVSLDRAAMVPKAAEHVLHVLSGRSMDLGLSKQHLLLPTRRLALGGLGRCPRWQWWQWVWVARLHLLRCTVVDLARAGVNLGDFRGVRRAVVDRGVVRRAPRPVVGQGTKGGGARSVACAEGVGVTEAVGAGH
eukprot:m.245894 g.245894  ORF g.245894 m.245894 type:complete len:350 (+) comp26412_c0_seq5:100-1149(+)